MPQHAVLADEGDVHVGALTDVAGLVDEDAVVEPRLLRLELHEDVGQVVGALGDGVQRRLDRIARGHHPETVREPGLRIRETAKDYDEKARFSAGGGGESQAPGSGRDPVPDGAV